MGFRRSDLQEVFFVPGDRAFRVWGYSTPDRWRTCCGRAVSPRAACPALGELIYVRMQAAPPRGVRREPVRMALLMVTGADARGAAAVRLVQDFGRTDAPAGAAAPWPLPASPGTAGEASSRKRGSPPGSRSRKAPATNGHDAGPPTL